MNITQKAKALMDLLPGGPWMWGGHKDDVRLLTEKGGRHYLMGVARCGFSGAQFTFQVFRKIDNQDPCKHSGLIHYGWQQRLYVSRAIYDLNTIIDIDHPLAQLIKLIPELVDALVSSEAEVERFKSLMDNPKPFSWPEVDGVSQ